MRAARQPAQQVLRADDRLQEARPGTAQRRTARRARRGGSPRPGRPGTPAGPPRAPRPPTRRRVRTGGREPATVSIVRARSRSRPRPRAACQPRDLDAARDRIDAGDGRPQPRQRLGQQPAAAADVEHLQPAAVAGQARVSPETLAGLVADVGDPHRVELVQRCHWAARVPPVRLPGPRTSPAPRDRGRVVLDARHSPW